MKPLVLFIVGPTASGKSKLALILAKRLHGEIISADSMQVYRGMNIGTAKPSLQERKKIPHWMIDILPATKSISVYDYRQKALEQIRKIIKRGRMPLVVGGSGFYVRALLQGIDSHPGANPKIRKRLEFEAKQKGLPLLYEKLQREDPMRASQIQPQDARRIIRALEILQSSRQKPSEAHEKHESLADLGFEPLVLGIQKDRAEIYRDIEKRVDSMFRKGLVQECRQLARKKISQTAGQAIGYKQIFESFKGKYSLHEAKDLIKKSTRHFAKRQITWFKKEEGIRWMVWKKNQTAEEMARQILSAFPELGHSKGLKSGSRHKRSGRDVP